MNKTYPVLEFEYDLEAHVATRIQRVIDAAHAPMGLFDERGQVSRRELNYWWRHRAIPASREQVERLLENLRLDSTLELAERSFGLSLSDRYWIDDLEAPQNWADINFFDNDFSDDLGILTLGQDSSPSSQDVDYARMNLTSPNSTVGGDLRWVREDALNDFPEFVGDMLGTNQNIPPKRIEAIVRQVRRLADDLVMASHR
jgi:hypothetical protein